MTGETGHVNLRVNKYLLGESIENGAVGALRLEQSEGGEVDRQVARQNIIIPVGENAKPLRKELPIGHWSLDVTLPWGENIQDDFEIVADDDLVRNLEVERSPHEEWSWHHLAGAVPNRERYYGTSLPESERESTLQLVSVASNALDLSHLRKLLIGAGISALPSMGKGPLRAFPSLSRLPLQELASAVRKSMAIRRSPVEEIRIDVLQSLDASPQWTQLLHSNVTSDEFPLSTMARITSEHRAFDDVISLFHLTGQPVDYGRRTWAYVQAVGERRLLSLPLPWPEIGPGGSQEPRVDLVVRFLDEERGLAEVVIVDDQVSPMLGYMTSKRLQLAAIIADQAKSWLFMKVSNRLAAAGGGYVMLATRLGEDDGEWHQWIHNLSNWFPDVPDGAILEGAMYLNGPKSVRDFDRAAACFLEAYSRGLPFYSAGLSWLRSGLTILEADFPDLAEAAEVVRGVARMAETNAPFTTLRLPSADT